MPYIIDFSGKKVVKNNKDVNPKEENKPVTKEVKPQEEKKEEIKHPECPPGKTKVKNECQWTNYSLHCQKVGGLYWIESKWSCKCEGGLEWNRIQKKCINFWNKELLNLKFELKKAKQFVKSKEELIQHAVAKLTNKRQ